jgi:hypothetical protein
MRRTLPWLGALLFAAAAVPAANAQPCYYPPCAPDACGPGYYCQGRCGAVYGPNCCLRPPFEPFNGFVPPVCHGAGQGGPGAAGGPPPSPVFPTHPYARSPRDYFMLEEADVPRAPVAAYAVLPTLPTTVTYPVAPPPAPVPAAPPPAPGPGPAPAPPPAPAGEVPR